VKEVLAWLLLLAPLCAASSEEQIRRVLDDQVAAWNRGDVRGFMNGYEDSESLTFVGGAITKGHARVLENYLKRYSTKEKMGTLTFSDLEIKPLDADYAAVIGRWRLERAKDAGGDTGGLFTLLFRKTPAGWKIILDHTS
jgi:ketosteroid isomerase-like protein